MENPSLADDLQREYDALADRRSFGLNFERHVPEAVELPGRKVRKGDKVRVLPPRGEMPSAGNDRLWQVLGVRRVDGERQAALVSLDDLEEERSVIVDDLVVVAEFRDPIYPGLVSTGKVHRGGDKPFHTVINAENFHALQMLLFTHHGKVDCIYIDPPYNTGARDWKYNNNYVEGDDHYRHSKWLAFMERRLVLAKQLLNPQASVLIVTIDENERSRLELLVRQIFEDSVTQSVSVVINPSGAGNDGFNRVDEQALFVFVGGSAVVPGEDNLLTDVDDDSNSRIRGGLSWESFLRSGRKWYRPERKNLCYPILIDPDEMRIIRCGPPLEGPDEDRPREVDGYPVAWPVRKDMRLGVWRAEGASLERLVAMGYAYVSSFDARRETWSIKYLLSGTIGLIESGEVSVERTGERGQVEADQISTIGKQPKSVWFRPQHNAGKHGSDLLGTLVPGSDFDYPKSLYAVEDAIRPFVVDKPDAVILDFFAGSGTTAHAVMRLNRQDGGCRRSVSVTNNEVGAEEQQRLRSAGLRPADADWERRGICESVTIPRLRAAMTGHTADGETIDGSYRFVDEFPMAEGFEENLEAFALTYEAPLRVASNREFPKVAPLLWLRAGAAGRRIDDISAGWDVADVYGVIADLDQSDVFLKALAENEEVTMAFIATDEDRLFEALVAELPSRIEPVRLYEAYLRNFELEAGRSAR